MQQFAETTTYLWLAGKRQEQEKNPPGTKDWASAFDSQGLRLHMLTSLFGTGCV